MAAPTPRTCIPAPTTAWLKSRGFTERDGGWVRELTPGKGSEANTRDTELWVFSNGLAVIRQAPPWERDVFVWFPHGTTERRLDAFLAAWEQAVMATKQETFDAVARHLLTQGRKSMRARESEGKRDVCAYRGSDGVKCAVGCLIPDGFYRPSFEGWNVDDDDIMKMLRKLGHHSGLCRSLQTVHDARNVGEWPRWLIAVAHVHGLNTAVVDQFIASKSAPGA